jgi:hypothetical protein
MFLPAVLEWTFIRLKRIPRVAEQYVRVANHVPTGVRRGGDGHLLTPTRSFGDVRSMSGIAPHSNVKSLGIAAACWERYRIDEAGTRPIA